MNDAGTSLAADEPRPALIRAISLPLLVLYGLGVTIGAGLYVLIGSAVAQAGSFAPSSFLLAAIVMGFTAGSFAELTGRFPKSAGEAIYVDAGFAWPWLTRATGGFIILSAIVAAAAITLGGAGYVVSIIDLPKPWVVAGIVVIMGTVAAWGVLESVTFAAIFTVLEIVGLMIIVIAGLWTHPDIVLRLPEVLPPLSDTVALSAVFTTSLIAFFAFIGFDDVVNLVEETKSPKRDMPRAIIWTLLAATLIYFLVVSVAVLTVPHEQLTGTDAPISVLFERLTGLSPLAITLIAIAATLNGVVIQIIMASRVLYGLGNAGRIPGVFARVNPVTHTPLISTVIVSVLVLALFLPIERLAETTTQIILVVFVLVNLSLVRIKLRGDPAPEGVFVAPIWVPVLGVVTCLGLLAGPVVI
ncbi:MAG: amino acid permease [Rhodobacteraceae bacterium]|nr:amino acid permease [Paracoccaceae bacterium]